MQTLNNQTEKDFKALVLEFARKRIENGELFNDQTIKNAIQDFKEWNDKWLKNSITKNEAWNDSVELLTKQILESVKG